MEKYAEHIIEILLNRDISCFYNRDEMLVYSSNKSPHDSIYSVYGFGDGQIRNVTIYDRLISSVSDKKKTRVYLEELNDEIAGGCFLTNPHIEYIIFSSEYEVFHSHRSALLLGFKAFCLRPHELFTRYRNLFYQMTTHAQEKIRL